MWEGPVRRLKNTKESKHSIRYSLWSSRVQPDKVLPHATEISARPLWVGESWSKVFIAFLVWSVNSFSNLKRSLSKRLLPSFPLPAVEEKRNSIFLPSLTRREAHLQNNPPLRGEIPTVKWKGTFPSLHIQSPSFLSTTIAIFFLGRLELL